MNIDLAELLTALSAERPVFHLEADFQLALGFAIQSRHPDLQVRLETPLPNGKHLDVLVRDPGARSTFALELKYLTRRWSGTALGEAFQLKNQGAQDVRGYDCVKDLGRVEEYIDANPESDGALLVLSNDPYYWRARKHAAQTNASAFRLSEGTLLSGERAWGPATGDGTKKSRELALRLRGEYVCRWHPYRRLDDGNELRYLLIHCSH